MASVSIGTLWRAVRRELWTELLVCHRQTHNLWKWLHRAGSFWKWHFRSVRGEILCVCVWGSTWEDFSILCHSQTSPVDLGDDTFGNTVFLGMCVCFYSTGSTQQERRYLTVYTPLTDHVSRGLVCSNVARHAVAQRNQRSTTNYHLPTTGWCVVINRPESMVQQLETSQIAVVWFPQITFNLFSVKSKRKRNNHKEKLHSERLKEFCETWKKNIYIYIL